MHNQKKTQQNSYVQSSQGDLSTDMPYLPRQQYTRKGLINELYSDFVTIISPSPESQ